MAWSVCFLQLEAKAREVSDAHMHREDASCTVKQVQRELQTVESRLEHAKELLEASRRRERAMEEQMAELRLGVGVARSTMDRRVQRIFLFPS